jgi:hypothetical protein
MPGWEKGSPKRANNMTKYTAKEEAKGKTNMPGHVRASMNWNRCREMYGDKYSMPITDGAKVIVCKLKTESTGLHQHSVSGGRDAYTGMVQGTAIRLGCHGDRHTGPEDGQPYRCAGVGRAEHGDHEHVQQTV